MDKQLLSKLYEMYQREIYLYLFALCHNDQLAEDLMQETFLKAILSLPEGHTNMRAWLYLVARNLYFNYAKKEKVHVPLQRLEEKPDELLTELPEQVIRNERKRLLYEALNSLPQNRREVLLLQYFGGLSQKEIAAVMHITPENVRVLAYRGKRELKIYLEVHGYDIS